MKVLIAAGGSGGHLIPAQQLAQSLEADILFAGHALSSSPFFDRPAYAFQEISSASLKNPFNFFSKMVRGIGQSIRLIRRFSPDLVVGFGSFHSAPLLFAAALLRKKIILFEANCELGKVNRLFAPFAHRVAMQFRLPTMQPHFSLVPLLPWEGVRESFDRSQARLQLGLAEEKLTILVFGGSQGAAFLNQMIPPQIPSEAQVIHLTGKEEAVGEVEALYRNAHIPAVVRRFEEKMERAYAAADYAICRSGAGTIAELISHTIPALLIPFPHAAGGHQRANAEFLSQKIGGALCLLQEEANKDALSRSIAQMSAQLTAQRLALAAYRSECRGRISLGQMINID